MPILSQLIISVCMLYTDAFCVEKIHVCMRDTFEVNFFDDLSKEETEKLPHMIRYCEAVTYE